MTDSGTDSLTGTAEDLLRDGVLSVREATEFSRLSKSVLYQLMAAHDLEFVKAGRRRLIPKRALIAYLGRGLEARI
jgi:excisionase family DNA binding protein